MERGAELDSRDPRGRVGSRGRRDTEEERKACGGYGLCHRVAIPRRCETADRTEDEEGREVDECYNVRP